MIRIHKNNSNYNNNDLNFGSNQLKDQLVNYIYKTIELSRFNYAQLEFESELCRLVSQKYFVSVNFSGSNCLLVFTKIKGSYHSFLVERSTLSYNPQKVRMQNVKITNVKVKLNVDIYDGTIFDGTFIQNKKIFVITDVFTFKGQDQTKSKIDSKLLNVMTYLKSNYDDSSAEDDLILTVNKLYPISETNVVHDKVIPKEKNFVIRSICFYPEISGTKLIFQFSNQTKSTISDDMRGGYNREGSYREVGNTQGIDKEVMREKKIDLQHQINLQVSNPHKPKKIKKIAYVPKKNKKDTDYIFEMVKTDTSDVYILNVRKPVKEGPDDKVLVKRKKIGIAYIPNSDRTKWCKQLMKENEYGNPFVHCKFHKGVQKWEPILLSKVQKASLFEEFDVKDVDDESIECDD